MSVTDIVNELNWPEWLKNNYRDSIRRYHSAVLLPFAARRHG